MKGKNLAISAYQLSTINLFNPIEDIAVLDGSAVLGDAGADGAGFFRLNLVHDFHGLNNAERLADRNGGADFDEVWRVRRGLLIESADHGRGDLRPFDSRRGCGCRGGCWCGCGGKIGACGCGGRKRGHERAKVIEVSTFFQFQVKVLLGEVEVGEPVLIHKFDNSANFLEVHGVRRLGVGY